MATATEDKKHLSSVADADADDETTRLANELPDEERTPDDAKSIEDLAEEPTPTPPMQLALAGTDDRIPSKMGGNKPGSSTIRVTGARLPVEGVFIKGEVVELRVKVKIRDVGESDAQDDWGNVEKTTRYHIARMIEVTRVDAP